MAGVPNEIRGGARCASVYVVLPSHVAGIEIYTTIGRVPAEYQSLAGTCGVVLMWSK
jgi:hypothetical protein